MGKVADEPTRAQRIESHYQESAWSLAEWLVDAEDEIEVWKAKVARLESDG